MNDGGVLGSGGYRYFGVAKNLPGVRELLDQREERNRKQQPGAADMARGEDGRLMRDVYAACDAAYFGYDELYRSEYDDVRKNDQSASSVVDDHPNADARARYLAQEANYERRLRQQQIDEWVARKRRRRLEEAAARGGDFEQGDAGDDNDDNDDDDDGEVAAVSTADVQAAILKRKKEALLRQYISKDVRDNVTL